MATARELREIAMSLEGTTSAPHFDRTAFKVARIYATLAGDGLSANFRLTREEQAVLIALRGDQFRALNGAWGKAGWVTATLGDLDLARLTSILESAWKHAAPKRRKR
jgi:hypothetical protein